MPLPSLASLWDFIARRLLTLPVLVAIYILLFLCLFVAVYAYTLQI